ncbi:MAG: hypothetical protein KJO80_10870 [Gammaproteobacteria bacterium]|nr:hypothetical protein [Gammaproteobacteria bacterium]NNL00256.1 hypothetical protein [Xanthomonadales bacterium]
MNFWIFAIALLAVSAILISWPMFTGPAKDKITGLFIVLMLPLAGILLYQGVGTPAAINMPAAAPQSTAQAQQPHSAQGGQMEELVAALQQRMQENPDDPEGWLILGRSLKNMQRFPEAMEALSNANRLIPNNPMIMIDLAETSLFASGQPDISPEARQLIESALQIDPANQKGLWLLGMVSAQDGNDVKAIDLWQKLLEQLDPASGAAQSVTEQISMAQTRMGQAVTAPAPAEAMAAASGTADAAAAATAKAVPATNTATTTVAESGIPVTVSISGELGAALPGNATLFVFIHPSGARGMPLAVKRLAPQGFPMALNFSDADMLNPGMSLQDFEKLDISARVSMRGGVVPAPGDYQANLVTVDTSAITTIALHLDQRVP